MSVAKRRDGRLVPSDIIKLLEKKVEESGSSKDMFWARFDSILQLTPGSGDRECRIKTVCAELPKWINSVSLEEQEVDQYDNYMMKGIFLETRELKNLDLALLQIGSIGAKLLWSDLKNAHMTDRQMHRRCMNNLMTSPAYAALSERRSRVLSSDLKKMIERYTDESGMCRETVRTFFNTHHAEYVAVLQKLTHNLNSAEKSRNQPSDRCAQFVEENTQKTPLTERLLPVEGAASAADPVPAVCPEAADADGLPRIMEQLKSMEKLLIRIGRNSDEFDDDASGLCRFVEKTGSFLYYRSLSRLYELYTDMPEKISTKELEVILRNFFRALNTMEIKPIDEERMMKDFPEEYQEEISRRGGRTYHTVLCGWSYRDSMVIAPQFEEERKHE